MERKRHVGIREKPERLRQERFLSDPEERALEAPRAQKAECLQLGDQVRSGPHPRCSPVEANGGFAKKLQYPVLHSQNLRRQSARPLALGFLERRGAAPPRGFSPPAVRAVDPRAPR